MIIAEEKNKHNMFDDGFTNSLQTQLMVNINIRTKYIVVELIIPKQRTIL